MKVMIDEVEEYPVLALDLLIEDGRQYFVAFYPSPGGGWKAMPNQIGVITSDDSNISCGSLSGYQIVAIDGGFRIVLDGFAVFDDVLAEAVEGSEEAILRAFDVMKPKFPDFFKSCSNV